MRTQGTYYIRGKEGRTEGQTDGRTEGWNAKNYVPPLFFEKAGDNNKSIQVIKPVKNMLVHIFQRRPLCALMGACVVNRMKTVSIFVGTYIVGTLKMPQSVLITVISD